MIPAAADPRMTPLSPGREARLSAAPPVSPIEQAAEPEHTLPGRELIQDPKDVYEPGKKCECSKCASRLYQDGSADAGVTFKAPTHIDPAMSHSTVAGHEREHVKRETYQANQGDMKVVAAQVRLFQRACKECGTIYCSGGVTTVRVRPDVPMYKLLGLSVDDFV